MSLKVILLACFVSVAIAQFPYTSTLYKNAGTVPTHWAAALSATTTCASTQASQIKCKLHSDICNPLYPLTTKIQTVFGRIPGSKAEVAEMRKTMWTVGESTAWTKAGSGAAGKSMRFRAPSTGADLISYTSAEAIALWNVLDYINNYVSVSYPRCDWLAITTSLCTNVAASGRWSNQTKEMIEIFENHLSEGTTEVIYDRELFNKRDSPVSAIQSEARCIESQVLPGDAEEAAANNSPLSYLFTFTVTKVFCTKKSDTQETIIVYGKQNFANCESDAIDFSNGSPAIISSLYGFSYCKCNIRMGQESNFCAAKETADWKNRADVRFCANMCPVENLA